jgi:GT2 family glycosyltransferase
MPGQLPAVSIVIVSWNTKDLLRGCLASVRETVRVHDYEVYVVDNASADGSAGMVRREFPDVRLIENAENVGFARANNQVLPLCLGRYVLLLNSDTVLLAGAIDTLIEFMDRHPGASAVGPRLVDLQGRPQIMAAGYLPTLGTAFNHFFFLSRLWPGMFRGLSLFSPRSREPIQVEWLTGACLLVRGAVLREIGPLAEEYFMYAEDIDLGERMTRAGLTLFFAPAVHVIHIGGASSRDLPIEASTRWVTSMHRHFARDHSRARLVAFDLIHGLGLAIRTLIYRVLALKPGGAVWNGKARLAGASSRQAFVLARQALFTSGKPEP